MTSLVRLAEFLAATAAIVLAWQAYVVVFDVPAFMLPAPAAVGDAMLALAASGQLWRSLAFTLGNVVTGFLLGAAAALSLIALTAFTVSFFGNRTLENDALEAARGIASVNITDPNALPDKASLEKLESLRKTLQTLDGYKTEGAPYKLRMGLYSGNDMYPHVKEIWCQKFNATMAWAPLKP